MIKDLGRKILSRTTISKIKLGKKIFKYRRYIDSFLNSGEKYNILLGTPLHGNYGDHLIAESAIQFIHTYGPENRQLVDIPTELFWAFLPSVKRLIDNESIVYINGGGWMGNEWPVEEETMRRMVIEFQFAKKIIIFPQTVYYNPQLDNCNSLLQTGLEVYNSDKLVICLRDFNSFQFAKTYYSKARLIFCPDITLSHSALNKSRSNSNNRFRIAYCLRADRETVDNDDVKAYIETVLTKYDFDIFYTTTVSDTGIDLFERQSAIAEKLREFSEYDLIITDRLHGMIFSYLAGTPVIAMDNSSRKVSGQYESWLKESRDILLVEENNKSEVHEFINNHLMSQIDRSLLTNINFDELKENLK